ncbi:MAG: 3-deoxy-7-phosphoheptulonate synthase [Firmicutes bacterium]|nr:3-deoxy-7-phosphoheptulonate synthase [Bacillota bacterium]
MIVVLKENSNPAQLENLLQWLKNMNLEVHKTEGIHQTILSLVGDTTELDIDLIRALDIVDEVKRIQEPFKCVSRKSHPKDTVIKVNGIAIGGKDFQLIAGPCSVESEEQICSIAQSVKEAGATMLRGGAFKPRTSPYSFQGMRAEGIQLLLKAKQLTGLPIVTEIMAISQLPLFEEVDVIQVGARNMQNFEMLKELGRLRKPILLKRGMSNTLQELLLSAEYILDGGNEEVILCERGIRTFESYTRNTLDLSAVPALKALSHLPVIVDPSHSTGKASLVPPMSLAAAAAGADGLLIEVHHDPQHALCDGQQALTLNEFRSLAKRVQGIVSYLQNEPTGEAHV